MTGEKKTRRANGEGGKIAFHEGKGLYYQAIRLTDADGRKTRPFVWGKTRAEVLEKARELRARNDAGQPLRDRKVKLADWVETWVGGALAASDLKQSTKDTYTYLARGQLGHTRNRVGEITGSGPLADVTLDRLRPSHVEELIVYMREEEYEPSTIRQTWTVFAQALDIAVRDKAVGDNVVRRTKRPSVPKKDAVYLTEEQARLLLAALEPDPELTAIVRLMLLTGLRRGEVLGLKWEAVDFAAGELRVRTILTRTTKGLSLGEPKTEKSRRTVPLAEPAVDLLRARWKRQAHERMAAPAGSWTETGLAFTTALGGPLEPRNVLRRFDAAVKPTGLVGVRLHTMRHSAASLLLAAGVHMKVVQELLGHSSFGVTADTYSHVAPAQGRDAVAHLAAALG